MTLKEKGEKLSFPEEDQLINIEGMIDFRNHYFPNPDVIINSKFINEC